MSSIDDDEALFQDIYGEDSESEAQPKESEVKQVPAADAGKTASKSEAEDRPEEPESKPEDNKPEGKSEGQSEDVEALKETHSGGLTSVAIGKQLQEKSEYFNRDQGKMFIGGLNWDTTEEKLKDYFSKYGEVIDFTIMRDNATGRSRGFGFLTFNSSSSVDEVLKTQHILDGKVIDPKRAIPKEEQDKTGKIFVGGIAPEVTEQEFDEFFSQFGNVIDAQLMIDKDTGRSRGFGFVTFDSPVAVDKVTQNKYLLLKGRQMEIKRAEPRGQQNQRSGNMRGYNANTAMQLHQQMHPGAGGYNQYYPTGAAAAPAAAAAGYTPQMLQQYWQYWMQMQQVQGGSAAAQMSSAQLQQMASMMAQQGYSQDQQNQQEQQDLPAEKPLRLHSSNESGSDDSSNERKLSLPKGPRGGRGNTNRGRGGYGRNGGYHPYNR